MSTEPPSRALRSVYVRLPNWVGDVVMATSTLAGLRAALPDARITVEAPGFQRSLLSGLGSVDAFVPAPGRSVGDIWRHGRALRRERFDGALVMADSVRTALPPALARIPRRVGYARDPARRLLLSAHLPPPAGPDGQRIPVPMPTRYQAVLALLVPEAGSTPRPVELVVDEDDRVAVAARLASASPAVTGRYAVLTPGAAFGASKLYPVDQFAVAADGLARRLGLAIVFAPGPGEEPLCHRIAEAMEADALIVEEPCTSLGQLKALIADAALLVSNDTGPRHVAVALGTPVVCLMGPTDRRHTDYQLDRQRVLLEPVDCAPCHLKICPIDHRCMTRLAPERVVEAAEQLLRESPT